MCGRCRQVFNAFESLKRVEDDAIIANASVRVDAYAVESVASPAAETEATSSPLLAASPITQDEQANAEVINATAQEVGTDLHLSPAADSGFIGFIELVNEPAVPPQNVRPIILNAEANDGAKNAATEREEPLENGTLQETASKNAAELEHENLTELGQLRVDQRDHHKDRIDVTSNDVKVVNVVRLNDDHPKWLRAKPVRSPRHKSWLAGSLMLLIVLIAQTSLFLRATIVDMFPQTRPYFVKTCDVLGCTVSWGRDSDAIKIVESDLIEPPGKPGRLLVTATLANRGLIKQDLPAIELRLTDNGNQVLVSRVLLPADYLGRQPLPGEGIAPNAELFINLNIESSNKNAASGYGLRAYYQ